MSVPPPIPPLGKRIVVEPLDSERLTRIERNVVSRAVDAAPARAPRRWVGLAAAVGATALAAGVIGWIAHGHADGTRGATPELAGAPLAVHTEAQGSTLDIGDATIASSAATAFVVTRPDGGVLVDMSRGKVELDVAKRGARPPLVVRAGDTDVVVVGTHFTVDYGDGHGDVDVRVREGRVRIVHAQREVFVASGEEWTSAAGVIAMEDLGSATASGSGATIGDAAATGSGSGVVIAIGPGPNVLHDRVAVVPDASYKPPPPHHDGAVVIGDHGEHMSPGAAKMIADAKDPHNEIYASIRDVAPRPPLDVGTTDAVSQVKAYRDMVLPGGKFGHDASYALYSLALVQATRLGRTDDALQTIDQYLSRFNHGAELGAILWLKLRIHCLDRRFDSACHAAADVYLDKAPNGAGAHVAELIRATD